MPILAIFSREGVGFKQIGIKDVDDAWKESL